MPKPKIPEYYKDYKVTATGLGSTVQEAEHNLRESVKYHMRWIRGAVVQTVRWGDNHDTNGTKIIRNMDIIFKNRAFLRDKRREMTYTDIWSLPK